MWFFVISLLLTLFLAAPSFMLMALPYILTGGTVLLVLFCIFDFIALRH